MFSSSFYHFVAQNKEACRGWSLDLRFWTLTFVAKPFILDIFVSLKHDILSYMKSWFCWWRSCFGIFRVSVESYWAAQAEHLLKELVSRTADYGVNGLEQIYTALCRIVGAHRYEENRSLVLQVKALLKYLQIFSFT